MAKQEVQEFAALVRQISEEKGDERASKCGYDLLMGLAKGDATYRFRAWKEWLVSNFADETTTERDGAWVPAISENMKIGGDILGK